MLRRGASFYSFCFLLCLVKQGIHLTILYEREGDNAVPQFVAAATFKQLIIWPITKTNDHVSVHVHSLYQPLQPQSTFKLAFEGVYLAAWWFLSYYVHEIIISILQ